MVCKQALILKGEQFGGHFPFGVVLCSAGRLFSLSTQDSGLPQSVHPLLNSSWKNSLEISVQVYFL